jgi:group II intron reverse transcriptase/maturase
MMDIAKEMTHWNKLAKKNPDKRFTQLWKSMTTIEWIAQAWKEIEGNKGINTPGVDGITKSDITPEYLQGIAVELRAKVYRPMPVQRTYVPKKPKGKRPLGMPTLKDKIVQQALKMVLEPIHEVDFYPCSHGFRKNHSPLTALKWAKVGMLNTTWTTEGDIKNCFDNIPHGKLMEQLVRRIADEKILQLCWRFLKAGVMEDWEYHETYSGTPQGGIISPLFANIYLHQLDKFMMDLGANQTESKQECIARRNPDYRKVENRIYRLRRELRNGKPTNRDIIKELEQLEGKRKNIPYYAERHKGRLWYVRYADDFIIQMTGNKEAAQKLERKSQRRTGWHGTNSEQGQNQAHPLEQTGKILRIQPAWDIERKRTRSETHPINPQRKTGRDTPGN